MTEGPKIVFLHLQKTGGTALFDALCAHFPADAICPERHTLANCAPEELERFALFGGHFLFKTLDLIPGPKCVVTLLREPRQRLLSYFRFVKRHKRAYLDKHHPELSHVKDMTLAQYLEAGAPSFRFMVDQIGDGSFTRTLTRIRRMHAVGFADRMEASRRLIWQRLGLPAAPRPVQALNVTRVLRGGAFEDKPEPGEEVTPKIMRLLNRATRRERMIYRIAGKWYGRSLKLTEPEEIVQNAYFRLLGRTASANEVTFWAALLRKGMARGELDIAIRSSKEFAGLRARGLA
jgi:hypothetical protein